MDHLREALTDPCPEYSIMPLAVRHACLAGLESASDSLLPSSSITIADRKRKQASQGVKKTKKPRSSDLERKVDQLSSAVELLLPILSKAQSKTDAQEIVQPECMMYDILTNDAYRTGFGCDVSGCH
ncbi:hypothetical protein ABG768_010696 [Culter alburnus]|uniref:Uncharacterized protein n=1 Tax=Culter alburnus TaxID=194366 RepID=A0AAW1ZAU6_CULAL